MKQEIKDYITEHINEVINSPLSKIDKADLVRLVVIREKIKNSKDKKGFLRAISKFLDIFTDDD